jgi:hypothetical protein
VEHTKEQKHMMVARRHIFRAQALQEYARSREKDILPRMARPPVLLCCWLLLGLLFATVLLTWQLQVAVSVETAGVIVQRAPQGAGQTAAVLFVPASTVSIPPEQPITVHLIGQTEPLQASITSVKPGVVTPVAARQQYGLRGDLAWVITQPSVVVTITLHTNLPASTLEGRSLHAQMRVGSRSLLSLLPDLLQALL